MNIKIEPGAKVQITDKPIVNIYGDIVQYKEVHIHSQEYEQEPENVEYEEMKDNNATTEGCIRRCLEKLMQERIMVKKKGKDVEEFLFNRQIHWQGVYRILVDKKYCKDSDFDGFDVFIRTVMPEAVNKPYSKGSLKQISQTDFVRPFIEWRYDAQITKTRKPFDRMVAVAQRFKEILEENGL